MLFPKKVKRIKMHKRNSLKRSSKTLELTKGNFGVKAITNGRITVQQLEAARQTMVKKSKKSGKIWLRIFPDLAITSKPAEVRMGKGKGAFDFWCCPIKAGRIIFEFEGIQKSLAYEVARVGSKKLSVHTKFITQNNKI
uniref:Ribosomal protein L16 n=1 Tax=Proteomonas sulcata TaxID=77928 RepID=A0A2P1G8A9_9CRYP|nr:ribosomal protein L16 [Proteomonas sulcata]AVM81195.1 ribosomal protein L16 [Proteomonas sulcata]